MSYYPFTATTPFSLYLYTIAVPALEGISPVISDQFITFFAASLTTDGALMAR